MCKRKFESGKVWNLCECGGPLLVRYDLKRMREMWSIDSFAAEPNSMWRYAPALPVQHDISIVSLGEGMTPLLRAQRTGKRIGASDLLIKDEGLNPTGSFEARGLSCAVSMCVELGLRNLTIRSAGDAASALAAYAAAAGIEARIFMPEDVPRANFIACQTYGANVTLMDVEGRNECEGWFDVSRLKEPYGIEGEKTAGYEIAEQLGWELPDAILYPSGAGPGMSGMWKAFEEMEELGWVSSKRPKMIAVEAEGNGPNPVSFRDSIDAGIRLAAEDGIFAAPEGAACIVAAERLIREGFLKGDDTIVIYNTGSGLKHLEAYSTRYPRAAAGETNKLGGLITPR